MMRLAAFMKLTERGSRRNAALHLPLDRLDLAVDSRRDTRNLTVAGLLEVLVDALGVTPGLAMVTATLMIATKGVSFG